MKFTTAKAKVAALMNTLAAVQIFLGVVATTVGDDRIDLVEVSPLVTGIITLGITVYAVWKTENKSVPVPSGAIGRTRL